MNQLWPGERFADFFEKLVLSFARMFLTALILPGVRHRWPDTSTIRTEAT